VTQFSVFASAENRVTDKLHFALNAAARLMTGTQNYERGLSRLMHDDLHWLTVHKNVHKSLP